LVCLGRHTVTGLLLASGRGFQDWTADYRLYSRDRFCEQALYSLIRRQACSFLKPDQPLVVAMDDSIIRKTGPRIPGVAYRRDPLGPRFQVNLVRAQRCLQISAALPFGSQGAARLVPVDFQLLATAPKLPRRATPQQKKQHARLVKRLSINRQASQRLQTLGPELRQAGRARPVLLMVDGRFTNRVALKRLPQGVGLVGRVRSDAKLFYRPDASSPGRGRPRRYGSPAPSPQQLLRDDAVPWQIVAAFAVGQPRQFRVKVLRHLLWPVIGATRPCCLVVVFPVGYRLRKGSRLLYRQPAFLICDNPDIPVERLLQSYIWRWDIEVNFRDEKTLLGVGQAQVRDPRSAHKVPALAVAAYAMLLLAAGAAFGLDGLPDLLPPPKWRPRTRLRASTSDLVSQLRADIWTQALAQPNFTHFRAGSSLTRNPHKSLPDLRTSLLYAVN
jgi:hypothetical protein